MNPWTFICGECLERMSESPKRIYKHDTLQEGRSKRLRASANPLTITQSGVSLQVASRIPEECRVAAR